jgi:hypothetical protein
MLPFMAADARHAVRHAGGRCDVGVFPWKMVLLPFRDGLDTI